MFESVDHQAAIEAARQSEADFEDSVNNLLDAELISEDAAKQVRRELVPILDLLRSTSRPTEPHWVLFQRLWSFAQQPVRITPMNAANLCPRPDGLVKAINALRLEYNINVAQQQRTGTGARVIELERARRAVAGGVGLPAGTTDLVLIRNSSEGNNLINSSYTKWRGPSPASDRETVVVWKHNHRTNNETWRMRAHWDCPDDGREDHETCLFRLIEVDPDFDKLTDQEIGEAFTKAIDGNTRFVTFSETSNRTGQRIPEAAIQHIWEVVSAKYPNCHVHIDGTMTWGARRVDLSQPLCHSFVSSSHKWFIGPKETGMFWMDESKVASFMPPILAYDFKIEFPIPWREKLPDTAMRFQLLGQRDDIAIISLYYAQLIWNAMQPWKPYERVVTLAAELRKKLTAANWNVTTPDDVNRSSGIVWVEAEQGRRRTTLFDYLYQNRAFKVGAGGGGDALRLCPHVYNTLADIECVVQMMNQWRSGDGDPRQARDCEPAS